VNLAGCELIRAADIQKSPIAGFRRLLRPIAPDPTEHIILIADRRSILTCDQRCQRVRETHCPVILGTRNDNRP